MTGKPSDLTLVAIAKNEGKYIAEWIAFHFFIGVNRICVYLNDSSDNTASIVTRLSEYLPVVLVDWPSGENKSPQRAAYKDALERFGDSTWMGFWDIDEFVVPFAHKNLHGFLKKAPSDVTAIGINTRLFGMSGIADPNYQSVLQTFRRCSKESFTPNRHIKTVVKPEAVREMHIHHADMNFGRSVNSAFEPLILPELPGRRTGGRRRTGMTVSPVYAGIQINHYRLKTMSEFKARREQGNPNHNPDSPRHYGRQFELHKFQRADRNEVEDQSLNSFLCDFEKHYIKVLSVLQRGADRPSLAPRLFRDPSQYGAH